MNDKLEKAQKILLTYNQSHLLQFYDELSDYKKELLLNQILRINFEQILNLYDSSLKDDYVPYNEISPLNHLEKNRYSEEEISYYSKIGKKEIQSGSFAIVTMAGGQGTRLGYKGPKGTYEIDFEPEKKSLFQIMCEDILRTNEKFNITIPWYIMTSEENDSQTKDFFEMHNYWGYPKDKVTFFIQEKLPLITLDKKLFLQEPYLIKEASNGNGNVFNSMKKNAIIEDLEKNNIKWISFGGIDNILLKNIDSFFLGLTIENNQEIASKSIFKQTPLEKTAVYCKKYGKPAILDYNQIDLELSNLKDENGNFLYREANMLSHLMNISAVKKVADIELCYHRAFKKNAFVNDEGMKQIPDKPNSFKFENFIFDAFSYFDDMLLLRVNANEEFAPIKDFTGIYNPDTAKAKYEKYWGSVKNIKNEKV